MVIGEIDVAEGERTESGVKRGRAGGVERFGDGMEAGGIGGQDWGIIGAGKLNARRCPAQCSIAQTNGIGKRITEELASNKRL